MIDTNLFLSFFLSMIKIHNLFRDGLFFIVTNYENK